MFFKELKLVLKIMKIFKNWYMYPIVYFKLTNKKFVIFKTKTNLKIKLRVRSTDLMALTNVWVIEEYKEKNFQILENDNIIDIGSHIGLFAMYASQKCDKGTIFCFEPIKENYDLLLDNLKLNNIKNVKTFNIAVTGSDFTVTIYLSDDDAGHSIFLHNTNLVQVKSTSLKKIFDDNNIEKCDLIKMDCEGAEYEIIESLPSNYFNKITKMIIEYHFVGSKLELAKNLIKRLKSHSYEVSTIASQCDTGLLYALKN